MDSSGKGKAADSGQGDSPGDPDANYSNTQPADTASPASRLQQSAAGLARAMFSAGPDGSSMGAASDKARDGAPAGPGPSSIERGETSQARAAASADTPGSSTGRFAQARDVSRKATADYEGFLQGTALPPHAGSGAHPDRAPHPSTGLGMAVGRAGTAVREQEARDGAEVLDLLSQPDMLDLIEDPDVDPDLSPEDVDMLRRALFEGPSERGTRNWDSLLNLAPDFLLAGDPEATRQHLGVSDNAEGIKLWLEQWRDVLDEYTDEVWGDLGSLAQDARREVDRAEQQQTPSAAGQQANLKALGRLRQILAHVRGAYP